MVGGPHPGSPLSFMMPHNIEAFPQPPPAHMGIPPVHIDPKTGTITGWMDFDISKYPSTHKLCKTYIPLISD